MLLLQGAVSGVQGMVILHKVVLNFFVSFLLQVELFVMNPFQDPVHRQQYVNYRKAEQNNCRRMITISNLKVKDQLSKNPKKEREIQQNHRQVRQAALHLNVHSRPPQQVVLIHPIVETQSNQGQDCPKGNETGIEEGEPQSLNNFRIPLAHTVFRLLHELVGLALSQVSPAEVELPLDDLFEGVGIDEPKQRDEECI